MNALKQQLQALRSQLQRLVNVGAIAPESTWISRYSVRNRPGGNQYHYYKLVQKVGNRTRQQYLGKLGSQKYRYWSGAIARRNQIKKLQKRIAQIEKQLEKQLAKVNCDRVATSRAKNRTARQSRKSQTVRVSVPLEILSEVEALIEQYNDKFLAVTTRGCRPFGAED